MQKYVNILEEWDDIVSDNWQVSENSSLDPMTIIGSYDVSLSRVKDIVHLSEKKLNAFIQGILTEPLNSYWENQRMDLKKLDSE